MSLMPHIEVNSSYTRSINIERDSEAGGSLRPYILTSRAMQVLGRIAETLDPGEAPRAWALIGPYGSGKSAFGLFLAQLLGGEGEAARHARDVLDQGAPDLAATFGQRLADTKGFCIVALSGSPEALGRRLLKSLHGAAKSYFGRWPGRPPRVLSRLAEALDGEADISQIIELVAETQAAIHKAGGAGLLIVIDELGKFLEYEARHRGATEIHLLQALAEHAFRADPAPLQLVVLLHQSFEQYAQTLGEQLRNEWKKVQGRFESVPFLETAEQTIRVVRAALVQRFDEAARQTIEAEARRLAAALADLHALPSALGTEDAAALFAGCYPLHPVALLLLPTLCQRVAQNERTLFSYLGSREPHGFLDSLERLPAIVSPLSKEGTIAPSPVTTGEGWGGGSSLPWIQPADIYEYFILNQPGLVTDHLTHRRWAEVVTALERLGDAPAAAERMLKTIGLMNIVGAQGGLKPSPELLALSAGPDADEALALLAGKSIVTHRRYNNEYRVWQGSDFDLESALAEQLAQIGRVDIADLLNETRPLPAIVARRHAIQTGTLRYFVPEFVSGQSLGRIKATEQPTLFVCLADAPDEAEAMVEALRRLGKVHTCGVVVGSPQALREAVLLVHALLRLQREDQSLAGDPVAQREVKDRLAAARKAETALLADIFENPLASDWVFLGKNLGGFTTRRELQARFSEVMDEVYHAAPILRNELINRDKPSASAMSGRNKLLAAMFERSGEEDLGIEKYPAEKAMYRALLRATGLHRPGPQGWEFGFPSGKDPYRIKPVWQFIESRLGGTETRPLALNSLFAELARPPFGLKAGAVPVFFLAFFRANEEELALFEEGHFAPFLTPEIYERLAKMPKAFSLQRFRLDNLRETLFRRYAEVIDGTAPSEANLLAAAKPLARMMMNLPEYTKRTKRLSAEAIQVRDVILQSTTPESLPKLLVELAAVFGFDFSGHGDFVLSGLDTLLVKLDAALRELQSAHHRLRSEFAELLAKAFRIEKRHSIPEIRDVFRNRFAGLDEYLIGDEGVRAFLARAIDTQTDGTVWLLSMGNFIGRKSIDKWSDQTFFDAKNRVQEYAGLIAEAERIRFINNRGESDAERYLVRLVTLQEGEFEAFTRLDENTVNTIEPVVQEVLKILSEIQEPDERAALFVELFKEVVGRRTNSVN